MKTLLPISRRRFLSGTSAALIAGAAAPTLWHAASRAQVPGANERLRMALIGCGGQGQGNLHHFQEQGAQIVSVCDPDEGRMREAREKTGGNLTSQPLNSKRAEGDAVRSFQMMSRRLSQRPQLKDFLVHKSGPLSDYTEHEIEEYAAVFARGIAEVGAILNGAVVRPL